MRKILTVEDTFLISGRGLVITGWEEDYPQVKGGDLIEILRPDKTKITSTIIGIEMIKRNCFTETKKHPIGILVRDITKSDVPQGSQIYLVKE